MQTEFFLTRMRNHGKVAKVVQRDITARGVLTVAEAQCPVRRRPVLTATFERVDGGEAVPPLRDVVLRAAKANGIQTISGVEELEDGPLGDAQVFAQTWKLVPAAYDDLEQIERHIGRLVHRLTQCGVHVRMLPGGRMAIPGETRPDDGASVESA